MAKAQMTKRPPIGSSATVDGLTVKRTAKAGGRNHVSTRKTIERLTTEKRLRAYELSMQYVAQADIAKAMGITQGRVSQLVNEEFEARRVLLNRTEAQWREQEILRIEHIQGKWASKAEANSTAANILLSWSERKDRLLGLNVNRHELGLTGNTPSPNEPPLDLSLLTEDELREWERMYLKAQGREPEPDAPQQSVIGPYHMLDASTALIEQQPDASIVAVQPADESLRDQILKLHTQGMSASTIAETLGITRLALLAAIEDPAISGASMQ